MLDNVCGMLLIMSLIANNEFSVQYRNIHRVLRSTIRDFHNSFAPTKGVSAPPPPPPRGWYFNPPPPYGNPLGNLMAPEKPPKPQGYYLWFGKIYFFRKRVPKRSPLWGSLRKPFGSGKTDFLT